MNDYCTFVFVRDTKEASIEIVEFEIDNTGDTKEVHVKNKYTIKDQHKVFDAKTRDEDKSSGSTQGGSQKENPIRDAKNSGARKSLMIMEEHFDRPANCLGLTENNVLVVASSKKLYYTSLTKAMEDHNAS